MNLDQTSFCESLVAHYGHLLTLEALAALLHRSKDGIRLALGEKTAYSVQLNEAKVRIGRRIYFRTPDVAKLLLGIVPSVENA